MPLAETEDPLGSESRSLGLVLFACVAVPVCAIRLPGVGDGHGPSAHRAEDGAKSHADLGQLVLDARGGISGLAVRVAMP
jgi:hypothetical protein